jgi:hypothetical protein
MYFSIAAVSFIINLGTLIAYFHSVKRANLVSTIGTVFNVFIAAANLIVWIVAAAIYKYEKEITTEGKHNDLWGWSCSGAADAIQDAFQDQVNFSKYCTIQSTSWYLGLVQVGAMVLSVVIMLMSAGRNRTKKDVQRRTKEFEGAYGGPGTYGGAPAYGH